MTNDDIAKGLRDAAEILLKASKAIQQETTPWQNARATTLDDAEQARIEADTAYRRAIGASCEDCGGREAVNMY